MKGKALLLLVAFLPLWAYTPPEELLGPVRSIRTYKSLMVDIPAGDKDEPWLINADYDRQGRPLTRWFYRWGQETGRYEFRYEPHGEGREKTVWLSFIPSPDSKPPAERLAGYEHWYSLPAEDIGREESPIRETRFETVMGRPVKSVFRYYDHQNRLVRESSTAEDLDREIRYDDEGRLVEKRGFRGERTFWHDRYFYDEKGRLSGVSQSDLNRALCQREVYRYHGDRIIFDKYLLHRPCPDRSDDTGSFGDPWFRSVKTYDEKGGLVKLENYRWNGPQGLILTEELQYENDRENRPVRVEEVYRKRVWELKYDLRGNWVDLTYWDRLGGDGKKRWYRVIAYGEDDSP